MLVFVYGTLKRGFYNHDLLEKSKGNYLGLSEVFGYGCINRPGFPFAVKNNRRKVKGEVFKIPDDSLARLDALEGYPNMYTRSLVETDFGKAWMYYSSNNDSRMKEIQLYGWTEDWKNG